jgi:pyruvate kinase
MLSAETAAGQYPREAVGIMNRIIRRTESDPHYRGIMDAEHWQPQANAADAISAAARQVAHTVGASAIVTYTTSGATTQRAARERPDVPILGLTSDMRTARRLSLVWGVHSVHTSDVTSFASMVQKARAIAHREEYAGPGDKVVITAGVPFGTPGATNTLRIAWIERE